MKPGKTVLVINEQDEEKLAASATILETEALAGGNLRVTLDSETDFAGWQKGWTVFCLNTSTISHGETKDPKVLGSGDAEKRRQDFLFKADTVSFIPSNVSVTGVAPDMDVAVDGVKWEYRDLTDPLAEEADSWSFRLNDDDTLQVHFRRRLPTGTNNISVPRHRLGSGLAGTGVPPWSFTAPMKKNRFVTAIVQPFATAGGADREPVAAIRENAPANLAANGRAVSLRDFERLCARHASVWQAKARQVIGSQSRTAVDVVIVPAGGGAVTERLAKDLTAFVLARALPAITMTVTGYVAVPVTIAVTVFVDIDRYEKTDVLDRVAGALLDRFSLQRRGLGQPLYIAELMAACEQVEGVSTAVVDGFARKAGAPDAAQGSHGGRSDRGDLRARGTGRPSRRRRRSRRAGGGKRMTDINDIKTRAGLLLYRQLPEEYRFLDRRADGEPGDLESYLHGFGHLLDLIRGTTEQAYADAFADPIDFPNPDIEDNREIQTWLLPYLAELVGAELLAPDPRQRNDELSNTVGWYKTKGTLQKRRFDRRHGERHRNGDGGRVAARAADAALEVAALHRAGSGARRRRSARRVRAAARHAGPAQGEPRGRRSGRRQSALSPHPSEAGRKRRARRSGSRVLEAARL